MSNQPHVTRIDSSPERDNYETPWELISAIEYSFGRFDVDIAADEKSAKADKYYSDILSQRGDEGERLWCNPPFSAKETFFEWAIKYRQLHQHIIFCVPNNARESDWWLKYVWPEADEIFSLTPRVQFLLNGERPLRMDAKKGKWVKSGVAYSSCLVVYRPRLPNALYGPPKETPWNWQR